MATSLGKPLNDFNGWWMKVDAQRTDRFYQRDFMYFDAARGELVWLYALPEPFTGSCDYATVDFPDGLFAASISINQNDLDGRRTGPLRS
jgi:hypothetical protein